MFKNLIIELQKNGICYKNAAEILNISKSVFVKKLKGKKDFRLKECFKLQKIIARGNISLEYLFKRGFSLVEILIALITISCIVAALAPIFTKRISNPNLTLAQGEETSSDRSLEINYGDKNCSTIDSDNNVCTGSITLDNVITKSFYVTVVGGGGGGGAGVVSEDIEYTSSGTYSLTIPYGVDEIEVTLVSGGGGGAAQSIGDIGSIVWTHAGSLDRTYVTSSYIPDNYEDRTISTTTTTESGSATLSTNDLTYLYTNTMRAVLQAGGGGGGRGCIGTGGGGGAGRNEIISLNNDENYRIYVGGGGQGHAYEPAAGKGGKATYLLDSSGNIIIAAAGGGGGVWGTASHNGEDGESIGNEIGGSGGVMQNAYCSYAYNKYSLYTTHCGIATSGYLNKNGGGGGASPGGSDGDSTACLPAPDYFVNLCDGTCQAWGDTPGSSGGSSLFGTGGVYATTEYNKETVQNGQGYGSGGAGGGTYFYGGVALTGDSPSWTGDGAPGFLGIVYREIAHGGGAGGAGSIVPKQRFSVTPGETLTITVGRGGSGGSVSVSGTNLTSSTTSAGTGTHSSIKRGSTTIVSSGIDDDCTYGSCAGNTDGERGASGYIHNGITGYALIDSLSTSLWNIIDATYPSGASSMPALSKTSYGATGGQTVINGSKLCASGKGATLYSGSTSATGYGGCGGGGGYGNHSGGDGAPGYVKITLNPDKKGAGGGGSAGLSVKKKITLSDDKKYYVQIGGGGSGASIVNFTETPAKAGGASIFKSSDESVSLSICGGYPGTSGTYSNSVLSNGTGGSIDESCYDSSLTYSNGANGADAVNGLSGRGASTSWGLGGLPVSSGNGNTGSNYAAGGSGAGLNSLNSSSFGGDGVEGKILIEW